MYFLYQHIRLDKNEVFYVGVGTKNNANSYKNQFKRAYSKSRNFLWKRIVNITPYKVEILAEFNNLHDCLSEETRLIKLYGRIIDGTGRLANLVEDNNQIEEKRLRNLKLSTEKRRIKVYKYSKTGEFIEEYISITEAAKKNNTLPTDISLAIKGRRYLIAGYQWKDFYQDNIGEVIKHSRLPNKRPKNSNSVSQYNLDGTYVATWNSINEAKAATNTCNSAIRNCLCGISKSSSGYIWSYKKLDRVDPISTNKLKVYDKSGNLVGIYSTFRQAEKALGIAKNIISVYLRRNKPYYKYSFVEIEHKKANKKK